QLCLSRRAGHDHSQFMRLRSQPRAETEHIVLKVIEMLNPLQTANALQSGDCWWFYYYLKHNTIGKRHSTKHVANLRSLAVANVTRQIQLISRIELCQPDKTLTS